MQKVNILEKIKQTDIIYVTGHSEKIPGRLDSGADLTSGRVDPLATYSTGLSKSFSTSYVFFLSSLTHFCVLSLHNKYENMTRCNF